jgi:DNA (cytosine-5)-methyltransferase 1
MSFTIGSLFDGSGGFPLAAFMCGGTPVWASEIEPYPIAVTKTRFPYMKHLGSVTDIKGNEIEPVDVITFGSPCQDLSVAGKRAGLKHTENGDEETTRSGLFMDAVRIIKEMREATNGKYPRFAVWENVPGAFSSNKGEDFRIVLEELIKIVEPTAVMPGVPKNGWNYADHFRGDGWSLAYRVFDAQYWGVPQRRRRIYLVLDLGGECAGKVSFERDGLRGYFEAGRTPWEAVAGDAESGIGAADCTRADGVNVLNPWDSQGNQVHDSTGNNVYPCLRGCGGAGYQAGYVMQATAFGISPYHSNCMLSDNPHSGIYVADTARTLDAMNCGYPACNQGGIAIVEQHLFENHSQDSRYRGPLEVCPMLPAQLGTGGNNQPFVVEGTKVYRKGTRPHSVDEAQKWEEAETANTLNTFDQGETRASELVVEPMTIHGENISGTILARDYKGAGRWDSLDKVVCQPVAIDRAFFNQGQNALYAPQYYEDGTNPTIVAKDPSAVAYGVDCRNATEYEESNGALQAACNHNHNSNNVVRIQYIVRRLTPTECARLQGFPDRWATPDKKTEFTDEEYQFWLNVRNTHAEINGKAVKEYTKDQMLSWYNKLHTDSAEYKLWGNGIALPCALYVMQGIAEVFS